MQPGQPSYTALGAATHRAIPQVLEHGSIFVDPLALSILGTNAETVQRESSNDPSRRRLRLFIAVRTRFAEDALAAAVAARGVRQLVVLGAGLDTYAYRTTLGESLRIFELDHPATQAWKRQRLEEASITIPDFLTFVAVNFERETLADSLRAVGFDPVRRTFFTWLGVVPYLTEAAVFSTLGFIAGLPNGAEVVFDYGNPPHTLSDGPEARAHHEALATRVAAGGEAFQTYFETDALALRLTSLGFAEIEDLGPAQIVTCYLPDAQSTAIRSHGGHIVRASTQVG